MRRGHDQGWLLDENGRTVGINLGADFTAEHEWGIKGIQRAWGISADKTVFGIARRTITTIPGLVDTFDRESPKAASLGYREWGLKRRTSPPEAALIFARYGAEKYLQQLSGEGGKVNPHSICEVQLPSLKYCRKGEEESVYNTISTAWDEGSFGVHVRGLGNVNRLREVWEAIQRKDLGIWTGGGHVFQRAGLVLGIISRCPASGLEMMRAADRDRDKLEKASALIGLDKELTAKGKKWFALSPRWVKTDDDKNKTEFPVQYWLNPYEQDKYNHGWFTVEQLREWGDNKGPVMMTADQMAARRR
jgi:hypothetical protein